jgi:hypothetical protein
MTWPIEKSAEWEPNAILPFAHQRIDRPGGPCCPHCGSTEFFGGSIDFLIGKLTERMLRKKGDSDKLHPQCAVCEHTWTMTLVKAISPTDSHFIEWIFESIPADFEPIRVLARYYQLKAGRLARDKNGEAIGHVQA